MEEVKASTGKQSAASRILNAAEELFYNEGIQTVGIDRIVKESNVALNTMYKHFPSKDKLIECYLKDRDINWMRWLERYISKESEPREKILAIFDALNDWFNDENFRGCAFINASGELGATKPFIIEISKAHKEKVCNEIIKILSNTDRKQIEKIAKQIMILIEGAIVQAYINEDKDAAIYAKEMAGVIIDSTV